MREIFLETPLSFKICRRDSHCMYSSRTMSVAFGVSAMKFSGRADQRKTNENRRGEAAADDGDGTVPVCSNLGKVC